MFGPKLYSIHEWVRITIPEEQLQGRVLDCCMSICRIIQAVSSGGVQRHWVSLVYITNEIHSGVQSDLMISRAVVCGGNRIPCSVPRDNCEAHSFGSACRILLLDISVGLYPS